MPGSTGDPTPQKPWTVNPYSPAPRIDSLPAKDVGIASVVGSIHILNRLEPVYHRALRWASSLPDFVSNRTRHYYIDSNYTNSLKASEPHSSSLLE